MISPPDPFRDDPSEWAALGAVVADPALLPLALADLRADDLGDPTAGLVWAALLEIAAERRHPTPRAIADVMRRRGTLARVEGQVSLDGLLHGPLSSDALREVLTLVARNGRARRIYHATRRVGTSHESDPERFVSDALATLEVASRRSARAVGRLAVDVAIEYAADLERRATEGSGMLGLSTGFPDLDASTSGLHAGTLVVLGGRPGMGKSAFAGSLARNVAATGRHVAVFSLEMSATAWWERFVCADARVDARDLACGTPRAEDVSAILRSTQALAPLPITFYDAPVQSVEDIRAACLSAPANLGLVIVDHLGLCRHMPQSRGRRDDQAIGDSAKALRAFAKLRGIPVLLLCQLNRKAEDSADKRPSLRDLRDSGEIEQDADQVWLLYREAQYTRTKRTKAGVVNVDPFAADITIAKVRDRGRCARIPLRFEARYTRFDSATTNTDHRPDVGAAPNWQDGSED